MYVTYLFLFIPIMSIIIICYYVYNVFRYLILYRSFLLKNRLVTKCGLFFNESVWKVFFNNFCWQRRHCLFFPHNITYFPFLDLTELSTDYLGVPLHTVVLHESIAFVTTIGEPRKARYVKRSLGAGPAILSETIKTFYSMTGRFHIGLSDNIVFIYFNSYT